MKSKEGTESKERMFQQREINLFVREIYGSGENGDPLHCLGEGDNGQKGDIYKSEGERQIAWLLKSRGIRFYYEYPLAVIERGKTRIWYPDFFMPEYGMIIEYAGMMGDDHYRSCVEHKRDYYQAIGLPAVLVDKSFFKGYWPEKLLGQIEKKLTEALSGFQDKIEG